MPDLTDDLRRYSEAVAHSIAAPAGSPSAPPSHRSPGPSRRTRGAMVGIFAACLALGATFIGLREPTGQRVQASSSESSSSTTSEAPTEPSGFVAVPPEALPEGLHESERRSPAPGEGGSPYFGVTYSNSASSSPRRSLTVNARYAMSDATAENEAIFALPQEGAHVTEVVIRGRAGFLASYPAPSGGDGYLLGWAESPGTLIQISAIAIDADEVLRIAEALLIDE